MSLTVKAYLEESGRTTEIRRFRLDEGTSATNYLCLAEKASRAFASLQGKAYQIYWKDSDGDRVTFSSDDELAEALNYKDDIFRVYLVEVPACPVPQQLPAGVELSGSQLPLHAGVACDGCQGPICGMRYKCVVCPDFDLCSACERKALHAEHDMLRIARPRSRECPSVGGHCSGSHADGPDDCESSVCECCCRQSKDAQLLNPVASGTASASAVAPGTAPASPVAPGTAPASAVAPGTAPASAVAPGTAPASPAGSGSEAADFMRRIGERVAALLDPLAEQSRGTPAEKQTTTVRLPSPNASSGRPTDASAEPSGLAASAAAAAAAAPAVPQGANARVGSWLGSSYPFWPTAAAPYSSAGYPCQPYPRWPAAGAPYGCPTVPAASGDASGEQRQQDAVYEARVASAAEAMRAMGFSDEGGWLTAILRSNGCDLPKAIDEVVRSNAVSRRQ